MFETALAYTNVLRVADNAVLFKLLAKTIGMQYGIIPSFMAKPYADVRLMPFFCYFCTAMCLVLTDLSSPLQMPGTSGHIHLSLRTPEGKNAFAWTGDAEGRPEAQYKDTKHISQLGEWFLAGILDGLQDGASFTCLALVPPDMSLCLSGLYLCRIVSISGPHDVPDDQLVRPSVTLNSSLRR